MRKKQSDTESVASSDQVQVKNFHALMGEGEKFLRGKQYSQAIQCFTEALELEPNEKLCLVNRSQCYLKLGNAQEALKDAEMALTTHKDYSKALAFKAESLYQMGEFEQSLVFFHRGNKLRPELQEFRLGIQKSQEAIDNAIGDSEMKLEVKGDLSFLNKQEEESDGKPQKKTKKAATSSKFTYQKPKKESDRPKKRERKQANPEEEKAVRRLLGDLYADKEYLEKLLRDKDISEGSTQNSKTIHNLIHDGLEYLDTRSEFWRQQAPPSNKKRAVASGTTQKKGGKPSPSEYVVSELEKADAEESAGKHDAAHRRLKNLLKTVEKWEEDNKQDALGNIYSSLGNVLLEMGNFKEAEEYCKKDLELSKKNGKEEGHSRALGNLGRVYARTGEFKKAVQVWEEKLPMVTEAVEYTWLYHEIGRCHLELGKFVDAIDYGQKSYNYAQDAEDVAWQMNAIILMAQARRKAGDLQDALENFERARSLAEGQGDQSAMKAIDTEIKAINRELGGEKAESEHRNEPESEPEREPEPESEPEPEQEDRTRQEQREETVEEEEEPNANEETQRENTDDEAV